jgi:hypothetical protein
MRLPRTLSTVAVLAALITLSACGSDDEPSSGDPDTSTVAPNSDAPSTDPADDETDTATSDACTIVTDDEISGIVGGKVTREAVPGGGCTFNQEDARAVSISLNTSAYDEGTGGFDGAVTGMSAQFEGAPGAAVDGVGDEAFAKTGTTMGGSNQQAGGIVHVGGTLVQVTLIQGNGLSADKVKAIVIDALKLVASKL